MPRVLSCSCRAKRVTRGSGVFCFWTGPSLCVFWVGLPLFFNNNFPYYYYPLSLSFSLGSLSLLKKKTKRKRDLHRDDIDGAHWAFSVSCPSLSYSFTHTQNTRARRRRRGGGFVDDFVCPVTVCWFFMKDKLVARHTHTPYPPTPKALFFSFLLSLFLLCVWWIGAAERQSVDTFLLIPTILRYFCYIFKN